MSFFSFSFIFKTCHTSLLLFDFGLKAKASSKKDTLVGFYWSVLRIFLFSPKTAIFNFGTNLLLVTLSSLFFQVSLL